MFAGFGATTIITVVALVAGAVRVIQGSVSAEDPSVLAQFGFAFLAAVAWSAASQMVVLAWKYPGHAATPNRSRWNAALGVLALMAFVCAIGRWWIAQFVIVIVLSIMAELVKGVLDPSGDDDDHA